METSLKYKFTGAFSEATLVTFAEGLRDGSVEPDYKSEDVPTGDDAKDGEVTFLHLFCCVPFLPGSKPRQRQAHLPGCRRLRIVWCSSGASAAAIASRDGCLCRCLLQLTCGSGSRGQVVVIVGKNFDEVRQQTPLSFAAAAMLAHHHTAHLNTHCRHGWCSKLHVVLFSSGGVGHEERCAAGGLRPLVRFSCMPPCNTGLPAPLCLARQHLPC